MEEKFILTNETKEVRNEKGEIIVLHRICAVQNFYAGWEERISIGKLGGWVESEDNLSQFGTCWVGGAACVWGNAKISDNARVYGYAKIGGNALIKGSAKIYESAKICGDVWVFGKALVYGKAMLYGNAEIRGGAQVYGDAIVCENAKINGNAQICDDTMVCGETEISGTLKADSFENDEIIDKSNKGWDILRDCGWFGRDS